MRAKEVSSQSCQKVKQEELEGSQVLFDDEAHSQLEEQIGLNSAYQYMRNACVEENGEQQPVDLVVLNNGGSELTRCYLSPELV